MERMTIDHATLARLAEAGDVRSAHIVGQVGGWGVLVNDGGFERSLAVRRSQQVRLFRRFETLVSYLKEIGIVRYDVDATHYELDSLKASRSRPDPAVATRSAHETAAHSRWLIQQVQEALDDPRPSIAHDQVMQNVAAKLASLKKGARKT